MLFQKRDHAFCRIFLLRYNILDIAAKRRLNGGLVFFLHFDDIRHNADDALFGLFLLHHHFDGTAVSLIALGQVIQRIQPGLFLMVFLLCLLQYPVIFRQKALDLQKALFRRRLFFIQLCDLFVRLLKLILQFGHKLIRFRLVRFYPHQPACQLRLSDLGLLQHRVKTLHPGSGVRPVVQRLHNNILGIFDLRIQLLHLRLHFFETLPCLIPRRLQLCHLLVNGGFLCHNAGLVGRFFRNIRLHRRKPV